MKALNILVVDDARFIRDLVRKAVKAQFPSCQVDDAADGLQAQTKMKSGTYHVLLCDWEMPNMSGLELLQWMRTEERYEKVPFMMITSRSEKSHIVKAVEAGVNDYIGKPFNNEQLGTKLARLIYKFYKMSPMQTARQAQQSDNASLLTGAAPAKPTQAPSNNASLLTGAPAPPAKAKPSAASANLLAGAAPSAQLVDKPKAKKGAQGVPGLFDQVVVDIVSKEEDIVARVNCFVCAVSSPDKRIDGELFNLLVRYEDEDPEKLAALSKFVAKVR